MNEPPDSPPPAPAEPKTLVGCKTDQERAELVLRLMSGVEAALVDAEQPLKVLVCIRVASTFAIMNSVSKEEFLQAAGDFFDDTAVDLRAWAKQIKAEAEARS